MDFEWSGMLFFFTLQTFAIDEAMRMVLAIGLFEFRSRKGICSMYAELLRCTVYATMFTTQSRDEKISRERAV